MGAVGFAAAGGAAGLAIGAGAGLLLGAAGAFGVVSLLRVFSTSPGLEIFERSIFGFISAAAAGALRFSAAASAALAKCLRTLSASSCSSELEWLFFSVTPMLGRKSSTALLLTSSSRAKSLMRTFSIQSRFLIFQFSVSNQCCHSSPAAAGED